MSDSDGGSGGSGEVTRGYGFEVLSSTRDIIQEQGWQGLGQSAIGTVLLAVIFGGVDLLNAMLNVPIGILNAIGVSVADLNTAIFGGLATFIGNVLTSTGTSFGTGWTALLGPFQGPLGVFVALVMIWEVLYFLDVTDSDVFGFVIDLPDLLFQNDSSGVDGEDDT